MPSFSELARHEEAGSMPRDVIRQVTLIILGLIALAGVSCKGTRACYPVTGKVFVNGKPAEGVTIVFHPVDDPDPEPAQPSAVVQADGSFTLKSYFVKDRVLKEGSPAGKFRVTCVWYPEDLHKHLGQEILPDKLQG